MGAGARGSVPWGRGQEGRKELGWWQGTLQQLAFRHGLLRRILRVPHSVPFSCRPAGLCYPALFEFWLLSCLVFSKNASLARAEYLRLCRCDTCCCTPLNPHQSQKKLFGAFWGASLASAQMVGLEHWRVK